jgi:hypothetical protein
MSPVLSRTNALHAGNLRASFCRLSPPLLRPMTLKLRPTGLGSGIDKTGLTTRSLRPDNLAEKASTVGGDDSKEPRLIAYECSDCGYVPELCCRRESRTITSL